MANFQIGLARFLKYIFQQLYNMADIAIVGHTLGDNSLAAIGASAAIFELIFGFALGIGNGLSMVAARSYGAKPASDQYYHKKICSLMPMKARLRTANYGQTPNCKHNRLKLKNLYI